jgi:hypothetical protein
MYNTSAILSVEIVGYKIPYSVKHRNVPYINSSLALEKFGGEVIGMKNCNAPEWKVLEHVGFKPETDFLLFSPFI